MRISVWAFVVGMLAAVMAFANVSQWQGHTPEGTLCKVVAKESSSEGKIDILVLDAPYGANDFRAVYEEKEIPLLEYSLVASGEKRSFTKGRLSIVIHEDQGELSFRLNGVNSPLGIYIKSVYCRVKL